MGYKSVIKHKTPGAKSKLRSIKAAHAGAMRLRQWAPRWTHGRMEETGQKVTRGRKRKGGTKCFKLTM